MIPIKWVGLKPEQLGEVLGAAATPTAALTFEAPINAHFDVLFDHAAAAAHGSDLAADGAAQFGRDGAPVVDAVAVAQEIAKEGMELLGTALAQGAAAQGFENRFALRAPLAS